MMEIGQSIDNSQIRRKSGGMGIPILDYLLSKIQEISKKEGFSHTLFAVCPNSLNVLKAALRAAKRADAPIKFAATLNQVDIDGGYTGWTQDDLIRKIKEESYRIGYEGPIIVAVDHGGPWVKDLQTIERWKLDRCMEWAKRSFEAALLAGYDLLHIDATVDIYEKNIKIETVVERTVELIAHVENFRNNKKIKPISYEIGTEEVHGGLADISVFKRLPALLKDKLTDKQLGYIWPIFIVGKVGTDLHTTTFDSPTAEIIVDIAKDYGSYIKGHYTDFVSNPEDYPKSGMGAANVGPEFTIYEYDALLELWQIEEKLYENNRIACRSNFKKILTQEVLDSNRWRKWLLPGENDFDSLSSDRKEWLLKTSSRYVWANPKVICAQTQLYKNLELEGIDAENWVLLKIEESMDKYFRAFNLINLNKKIQSL
ncbi:MAG: class II D-tagatose-bisphosphate aldolase, non-catalytic subunit [Actinobacteria bacterium]|nr:class II D-tagatose-bisphosphate aldolase, non-catalytic subunit [Actinomycetota bacterium]